MSRPRSSRTDTDFSGEGHLENYETEERDSQDLFEKDLLLSLNNDIASVHDRKDVLIKIRPKLRQLFGTENIFICILNEADKTLDPFLRVYDKQRSNYPGYEEVMTSKFPRDGFIDTVLSEGKPLIFDVAEVNKWPDVPNYMCVSKAAGIEESLSKALYHGDRHIGILTFWSENKHSFADHHLKLIDLVSDQISIAVTNVIANESIRRREKENETLLLISNEISAIRNKADLTKVIGISLKKYVQFDDSIIAVYNKEQNVHKLYAYHVAEKRLQHPEFQFALLQEYFVNDNNLERSHTPTVVDLDGPNVPSASAFIKNVGIKEFASIKLVDGDNLVGLFVLLSEKKNSFTESTLYIMQRMSYQISIAVAKLLANEEIQNRENEKEILLTIGKELASIRDKKDLLPLLKKQFERVGFYNDITIAKVDSNNQTFSTFLANEESDRVEHTDYPQMRSAHHSFPDGVFEKALRSNEPVIFDLEEIVKRNDAPGYVKFLYQHGTVEMAGVSLRDRNTEIGVLLCFSNARKSFSQLQLNLVQGIGNQLGTAVANILANEEIKDREYQKSILLSLSTEIAAVRNKEDLFWVVNAKLKELFSIAGFGIALINLDGTTHSAFLVDTDESVRNDADFKEVISKKYSVKDGVFNVVLNSDDPVTFKVSNLPEESPDYVQFWKKIGIQSIVGVPLRVGKTDLGCLFLHADPYSQINLSKNLLKGVCAQISIAISNIWANESIQKREAEKSALLAFSNRLSSVRNKMDLSDVIQTRLKELVSCDNFIICLVDERGNKRYIFLQAFETDLREQPEHDKIVTDKYSVRDGFFDKVLLTEHPIIFDIEAMVKNGKAPDYVAHDYHNGTRQIIGVPLRDGAKAIGAFLILQKQHVTMEASILRLIEGVSYQLSISVANILANARIEQQLEEISRYKEQLEKENLYLQEEVGSNYTYNDIIGSSAEMQSVFHLLSQVAFTNSTVLLLGETGTGKELFARAIHNSSNRKDKLLVKINCASIPSNLIESELFGHEKGAFTGALERRIGKFELANKGTLFLDEIGELPMDMQAKLLRVLQEKEIERVGGKDVIQTDARIIAATNRNLEEEVRAGKFRSDLYYRLNVFPITIPPLRDRKADIPLLASFFVTKFSKNTGKKIHNISDNVLQDLQTYSWPGNVRELEHLIERSVLTTYGNTIKEIHLPSNKISQVKTSFETKPLRTHEDNERDHILFVLKKSNGKISGHGGAAELLGLKVSTLTSKIKKLGIKKENVFGQ